MLHLVGGEELAELKSLSVISRFATIPWFLVVVELDVGEQRVAVDVSGEPDLDLEAQARQMREQRKSGSAGGYSFSCALAATPTAARRSG